jgi:hypothetical protein
MGGAIPLVPLFALMAWTGITLSLTVSIPSRQPAVFRLCSNVLLKRDTLSKHFHFLHREGFKDPAGRVS